jgi:hypothetical protein
MDIETWIFIPEAVWCYATASVHALYLELLIALI